MNYFPKLDGSDTFMYLSVEPVNREEKIKLMKKLSTSEEDMVQSKLDILREERHDKILEKKTENNVQDSVNTCDPKPFNFIAIDPNRTIVINSEIRGKISLFSTKNTVKGKNSIKFDEIETNNKSNCMEYLKNYDLIIADVTKSSYRIIETWCLIRDIKKFLENCVKEGVEPWSSIKTFILISSLMTWSDTPELFSESEFYLKEHHYYLRRCHEFFEPYYLLEQELLHLCHKYRNWIRCLILGTGIIYGPNEDDLSSLMELSQNENSELPIFGTGQNLVPVIHIEDLLWLLKFIINNYPENYEYVFAVEPNLVTQNDIIALLCKSILNGGQSRIVDSSNCLLYKTKEEDVLKISANIPAQSYYQHISGWKNMYTFSNTIPLIVRRYFSLIRKCQPPCVFVLGPTCRQVTDVAQNLNTLLGTVYLTPELITDLYVKNEMQKDFDEKKLQTIKKSINSYTSLPRGKGMIKALNYTFLQPSIQKRGYVLQGFPMTYNEANLLDDVFSSISSMDKIYFHHSNISTTLKPTELIVLLMQDKDIIKDVESMSDEQGQVSSEFLLMIDSFRSELGSLNSVLEYFDQMNIMPKLFYISEYKSEIECAQSIFDMIKAKKAETIIQRKEDIKVTNLLNLMSVKKEVTDHFLDNCNNGAQKTSTELITQSVSNQQLVFSTEWNIQEHERESMNLNFNKNDSLQEENFELKITLAPDKIEQHNAIASGPLYNSVVAIDEVHKIVNDADGNVSQWCIKNIKSQVSNEISNKPLKRPSTLIKKKSSSSVRTVNNMKFKSNTQELHPVIEWTSGSNKVLKGVVTEWIREDNSQSVDQSGSQSNPRSGKYSEKCSNNALVPINVNNSNSVRTGHLFKSTQLDLYKNVYVYISPSSDNDHSLTYYRKSEFSDELVLLDECSKRITKTKDITTEPKKIKYKKSSISSDKSGQQFSPSSSNLTIKRKKQTGDNENFDTTTLCTVLSHDIGNEFSFVNYLPADSVCENYNINMGFYKDNLERSNADGKSVSESGCLNNLDDVNLTKTTFIPQNSIFSLGKSIQSSIRKVKLTENELNLCKTFHDKFNFWLNLHLDYLKQYPSLKSFDKCTEEKCSEECSVYLFERLVNRQQRMNRDESIHRPDNLANSQDLQKYFNKNWFHFRTLPPNLKLLPPSLMAKLEKHYICNYLQWWSKQNVSSTSDTDCTCQIHTSNVSPVFYTNCCKLHSSDIFDHSDLEDTDFSDETAETTVPFPEIFN